MAAENTFLMPLWLTLLQPLNLRLRRRQIALHHKDLAERMEQLKKEMYDRLGEHDTQLNAIYDAIENMLDDTSVKKTWEERERIGYKK